MSGSEKTKRRDAITNLISSQKVVSQEQLLSLLEEQNIETTQATLSRDLKSMKVSRVFDGHGGYNYSLAGSGSTENLPDDHYLQDIRRGVISLDSSGNIAVINTLSGHANAVAAALDNLNFEEIVGTVAGDDTIMVLLRSPENNKTLSQRLAQITEGKI